MSKLADLIAQWESRAADGHSDTDYHAGQAEAYKRVLAEIAETLQGVYLEWRPVSEPPDSDELLCLCIGEGYVGSVWWRKGYWVEHARSGAVVRGERKWFTHWAPMPEMPK